MSGVAASVHSVETSPGQTDSPTSGESPLYLLSTPARHYHALAYSVSQSRSIAQCPRLDFPAFREKPSYHQRYFRQLWAIHGNGTGFEEVGRIEYREVGLEDIVHSDAKPV
jgi:hypothetical protein